MSCDKCHKVQDLVDEFVKLTNAFAGKVYEFQRKVNLEIPTLVPELSADIGSTVDISFNNIPESSIPEVKQKKGKAFTTKKNNAVRPKATKTRIEKNSGTVETSKPNTRSRSKEPSTSTKTTQSANKSKEAKSSGATDNPVTNKKGSKNNVSSVADSSSFRIDMFYDNIPNCSIPEIKQERVTASTSKKSKTDELNATKAKIGKYSVTVASRKANTQKSQTTEPSTRTTRAANKRQDPESSSATNNLSMSNKDSSMIKERSGKGPKANSTKSELPKNSKDDRVVGVFEKRLLKQEKRRTVRRTMRRERRLARAIGELSRIISNHAQENGYLPVASQEQQNRSTLSQADSDASDSDSSCSCSDSSCSCWMYSDSDESTDSSDTDVVLDGRSR